MKIKKIGPSSSQPSIQADNWTAPEATNGGWRVSNSGWRVTQGWI